MQRQPETPAVRLHYSMKAGARPAAGLKYRSIIINTLRREMICEGIMTRENGVYARADA